MSMDDASEFRKRVEAAVLRHHKKQLPKERRGPNDNPEARVVLALKKHLHSLGFSMDVVDSSTYNKQAGYNTHNVTTPGFSDLVGCSNQGLSVYIEVKAPGKRNNVSHAQREFLTAKIKSNCFAIVCDSCAYFDRVWAQFQFVVDRQALLLVELPKMTAVERRRTDENLSFDD
jgi:hypothetical protein